VVESMAPQQSKGRTKQSVDLDGGGDGGEKVVLCVEPWLEVRHEIKVLLVPQDHDKKGWRFWHLVSQGLLKHPRVVLMPPTAQGSEAADLIVYLPTSTNKPPYGSEMVPNDEVARKKLVVLDEGDGTGYFPPVKEGAYLAYFKRSWVAKKNGKYTGVPRRRAHNYFPMAYSMSDNYTTAILEPHDHAGMHASAGKSGAKVVTKLHRHVTRTDTSTQTLATTTTLDKQQQDVMVAQAGAAITMTSAPLRLDDISCTLRVHEVQPARTRVAEWVTEAVADWKLTLSGGVVGELNKGQRKEINPKYFSSLRHARIVVTCNPSSWEGDFRLWEAMASGALVFTDEMWTPMPEPLLDGVHVVVYDNNDRDAFRKKLKYYLDHPAEHARVARAGLLHSLTFHRAVSRIDYVLRSAHEEQEHDQGRETPAHYSRATGGRFLEDHEDGELEMAA
jgi:hypothetical protein